MKPAPERSPRPPRRGKKTWREKLADDKDLPKVVVLGKDQAARLGGKTCALPAPREIDALMRRVPRGKLTTIHELRQAVARDQGAEIGCPITTGIFSWIAAQAAAEAEAAGATDATPYWRTLKAKGELNPKYPGGIPDLAARLEAEGHVIVQKRNRYFVQNFERSLARP